MVPSSLVAYLIGTNSALLVLTGVVPSSVITTRCTLLSASNIACTVAITFFLVSSDKLIVLPSTSSPLLTTSTVLVIPALAISSTTLVAYSLCISATES